MGGVLRATTWNSFQTPCCDDITYIAPRWFQPWQLKTGPRQISRGRLNCRSPGSNLAQAHTVIARSLTPRKGVDRVTLQPVACNCYSTVQGCGHDLIRKGESPRLAKLTTAKPNLSKRCECHIDLHECDAHARARDTLTYDINSRTSCFSTRSYGTLGPGPLSYKVAQAHTLWSAIVRTPSHRVRPGTWVTTNQPNARGWGSSQIAKVVRTKAQCSCGPQSVLWTELASLWNLMSRMLLQPRLRSEHRKLVRETKKG